MPRGNMIAPEITDTLPKSLSRVIPSPMSATWESEPDLMKLVHTQTYLSLGYLSPEPGAPAGPHYHREPPLSARWPGQRGTLPALAQGLRPGPRGRSGESHCPLLSPGPPHPKNTQQGLSIGGDGDGTTWLQIS